MSKIKIIDLNKQLKSTSKETVAKMEALQTSVQSHLATLKRIEAELMQIARAEAQEKKLKEEQEARIAAEQARIEAENKEKERAQQVKIQKAEETKKEQQKQQVTEEKVEEKQPKEVIEKVKAEPEKEQQKETETTKTQEKPEEKQKEAPKTEAKAKQTRPREKRPQKEQDNGGFQKQDAKSSQKPHTQEKSHESTSGFVHVDNKKTHGRKYDKYSGDDRSKRSRKIKEKGVVEFDERYRRTKRARRADQHQPITLKVVDKVVMTTDMISVKSLAEKTGKPVADILKKLLLLGMMCNINSELDYDTAQLICGEFNITLELKLEKTAEDVLDEGHQEEPDENTEERPPIVTIMGHVDHGKTSLLDAIRKTRVTEHEAGGITQHIGAYTIRHKGNVITFLDTPGHEAFTAMRARGAQVTDIAILVVAADDGVMPQTVEAINHAKAAGVPIIVAINKIDKPNANVERIKQELTEHGLVTEDWGGETIMVPVSAVTKEGLESLLEMITLVAEVQELRANPERLAKGTIVEAKLDKGRGPVATVLVSNGTLHVSDMIVAGTAYGRVRAMMDDMGRKVEEAGPSMPVEVVGFSEVPVAGDVLHAVEQDKLTRQVAEERKDKQKADMLKNLSKVSLEDLFGQVEEGRLQELNIVIKADVQGSVEAVRQALEKLSNSEVRVKVIHAGVGAIKAMDVMLASASNAIIIGFNVRPDTMARVEAEKEKVEIRLYRIIYKAIEDIELAMKGMLAPEFEEVILGHAEVRNIFKVSSIGTIAGSYVTDGKITKSASIRLLRDNIVVHEGKMASLKRFKDDAKEVAQGYECGITLKNYNDVKEGDVIEAFEMQEIKR